MCKKGLFWAKTAVLGGSKPIFVILPVRAFISIEYDRKE
jgi:hypothetical protein